MKKLYVLLIILIAPSVFAVAARDSIKAGADDCDSVQAGFSATKTYLGFGFYNYDETVSMTFDDVDVPQGATINTAVISLRCYNSASANACHTKVTAVDADNEAPFDAAADFDNPTYTTAKIDWDFDATAWVQETWYNSPDISDIIEEVVGRVGWIAKNSINIILYNDGTTGNYDRLAFSANHANGVNSTPKLIIDYTAGAPENVTTTIKKVNLKKVKF
jgi:hypothetical protein